MTVEEGVKPGSPVSILFEMLLFSTTVPSMVPGFSPLLPLNENLYVTRRQTLILFKDLYLPITNTSSHGHE